MTKGKYIISIVLAVALSLTGCSTGKRQPTGTRPSQMASAPFWGKLLYEIHSTEERENICLSPLSAQLALAMTATGAEGKTLEQMQRTIELGNEAKELIAELNEESSDSEAKLANSIWINDRLSVKEGFIGINKEIFDAEVNTVPFDRQAVEKINSWCREKTNRKIESIIDKVEPMNMMFLINALYFKAPWLEPFKAANTTKEEFTTSKGKRIKVDMMKQTFTTSYYSDDIIQMVSKPFRERYEMLFILPCQGKNTGDAIEHLATSYGECIDSIKRCRIELTLPKFRSEYDTSLKEALCGMGMDLPFGERAQFGGISETPLYIDNVIQKSFISVDEEGAEAAAVTSVSMNMMSARPQQKITMTIDRPFLYIIRERKTGSLLFIGKMGNPNE